MKNMYSMKNMKGVNEESMKIKANIVVGENGEITLPEDFLRTFKLSPGDKLIVLGDEKLEKYGEIEKSITTTYRKRIWNSSRF